MSKSRTLGCPTRSWGVFGVLGKSAGSAGSLNSQSRPRMNSPVSLKPRLSFTTPACRPASRITERSPASRVSVLPCEEKGDLVMMCSTPFALFGPYNAAAGPSSTSMRSMSSLDAVKRKGTFTRSDGTDAMRLSIRVSIVPENTLLNPRATIADCTSPPCATSTPGSVRTLSITESAGRSATCSVVTTLTDAGASRIFSWRRDTVVVTSVSCVAVAVITNRTVALAPDVTATVSVSGA